MIRHWYSPLALLLAAAIGAAAAHAEAAADKLPGEGTFSGSWRLAGKVEPTKVGDATVNLAHVQGKVTLETPGGLSREFDGTCNGVSDKKTGGVARCVWTDAKGDQVVIALEGSILGSAGTVRDAKGRVIGGTGRYAGIEGEIHLDWLFVESGQNDQRFEGYVTKLQGSWKRP